MKLIIALLFAILIHSCFAFEFYFYSDNYGHPGEHHNRFDSQAGSGSYRQPSTSIGPRVNANYRIKLRGRFDWNQHTGDDDHGDSQRLVSDKAKSTETKDFSFDLNSERKGDNVNKESKSDTIPSYLRNYYD